LHTHKKNSNFSTISLNKTSYLSKLRPGESISYHDITNQQKKSGEIFFERWDWSQYKYSYLYSTKKWQQTIYWLSYDQCFCSLKIIAGFFILVKTIVCAELTKHKRRSGKKIGLMRQSKGGQTLCKLIIKFW